MREPAKLFYRGFESHSPLQVCVSLWCNGSMTVSKTVGRGSSPWRDAILFALVTELVYVLVLEAKF